MFENSWLNTAALSGMFLVLFASGELLYHVFKFKGEHSRKFVHACTGLLTMLFPLWLDSHWQVMLLCASFAGILVVSKKFDWLKSINDIPRKSQGSFLYPVIVYLTFVGYTRHPLLIFYFLPILTMAFCDPIAAIVGMRFPIKSYQLGASAKSIGGSLGFWLSASLLSWAALPSTFVLSTGACILAALFIGGLAMLAEGLSSKGWDNFTIPATVFGALLIVEKTVL